MKTHKYTEQEIKLTAVIYATRQEIVDEVINKGHLPGKIPLGGFPTALNHLARARGIAADLSDDEKLIFEAILADQRLPAGGAVIIPGGPLVYSLEMNQRIIVCPPPRTLDWD